MTARTRTSILALLSLIIVGGLAYVVWQTLFDGRGREAGDSAPAVEGGDQVTVVESDTFPGGGPDGGARLRIRLSSGQRHPDSVEAAPVAEGTPLSDSEIRQVLDRLPALTPAATDVEAFRLPDESLPPPRTGETVDQPFPPETDAVSLAEAPAGPLEVLRFSPEGEVPLAPFVSVTFNQPMVPLATVEELTAADVPVVLTPSLSGVWKWVGAKTLTFEADGGAVDRLPMATEFVVEVPTGTESATGGVLAESVSWRFQTPPPQIETAYPKGGPQPLEPLLFVAFDQKVDPAAVLETVRVATGGETYPLRLATDEAVAGDETVSRMAEQAGEGRWLAFRAGRPFPPDTDVVVTVGPGTPSAEGPLVTEGEQSFRFHTYPPLRITDYRCGWSNDCPPFAPLIINFSNPLDEEAFDQSLIAIDPPLPGATVRLTGSTITIEGATKGRTDYEVTVGGELPDIFGQTLGQEKTLTFEVGSARPLLSGPNQNLVTLDPAADTPRFSVYSINYERLRVRAYGVEPADWPAFLRYLEQYDRDGETTPPGREVLDETIDIEPGQDTLAETSIDLSEPLEGSFGHLIVVVEPPPSLVSQERGGRRPVVQSWVQVTHMALDAFADQDEMVVWATDLRDGAPLAGVTVGLGDEQATTGEDGTARLALPTRGGGLLMGQRDGDTAILPSNPYYWEERGWRAWPVVDEVRWYVFDDRQMYRPGEEVHLKGWLRRLGGGPEGDVSLAGDAVTAVRYTVIGAQGNELQEGEVDVNALGGFDLSFTLPENANLGHAELHFSAAGAVSNLDGVDHYHSFQIQEFRRPEFEVQARTETVGPYFVGESATVAVKASYYAGGPLPNAPVEWAVSSSPASYAPPNWPDFIFGVWTPWWLGPVSEEAGFYGSPEPFYGPGYDVSSTEIFTGFTDAAGEHYLEINFEEADKPRPFSVRAQATVLDVNRQAWAAGTNLLVHPADLYVGLRSERTFVEHGQPLVIETIVTDLDGNAIPGRRVEVRAARMEWRYSQGRWAEAEVDAQMCVVESAAEPVACTFATEEGGSYRITATVIDDQGRVNESSFTRWVSGGRRSASRRVEQETATLIPDKETYEPGDVAEILVQAPFSPAEGLLIVSRSGILYTESFQMMEGSHTLRVAIEEAHLPNLHVQVDLVGPAPRLNDDGEPVTGAPPRPAYATERLNLPISTRSRTLAVDVAPQESGLEPGGETTIDVAVTDAGGQPVAGAEVAVVVVDEAILALSNYRLADPVAIFYSPRESGVRSTYGRATVVLARLENLRELAAESAEATRVTTEGAMPVMPMAEAPAEEEAMDTGDARGAQEQAIRVRTDFNPLATFAPAVTTDSDGRAQVEVSLPDNLTRYRVMAVAVTEQAFGQGESNLTARLPLMVRPSAPRFLNFGDRFELPVIVQNQTDEEMTVDVVVQASNLQLTEGAGRRVVVPANDRVEVRFPAATAQVGTVRLQVAAVSGAAADAATVELPVYRPATTEAFATYGVIDEGAIAQPVAAPAGVVPQFGGLEIQTSSTALQALTDSVLYLVDYRYACSEQLASRILAVAALRDVLTAFAAEGLPPPAEMEEAVRQDIENLVGMQNVDGGFPIWVRGRESIPFYSIHVAHALQRARMKGFAVPQETLQRSLTYLREIESHYPAWYSERARHSLSAYALYVRQLMRDGDAAKAARMLDEAGLEELSLEAVAWLWPLLDDGGYAEQADAIRRHINNRAVETAGAANFTTSYGDQNYLMLHSKRRTDAIILDALIGGAPESDLIPKVVNGLLAHRTRGRWSNTQENVFVLLALDRYFNTFESQTPEFVARIWLGETYTGDHAYSGRSTERNETQIPMSYLLEGEQGTQDLILSKEGAGRLYYRLGLRYAPADLDLDPLDRGFVVERRYEAVDDPDDVNRDEEGVWHIRAGARVRVRLTMVAENRRYHVALVDALPAGLEIVNPAVAVAQDAPHDPHARPSGWWWYRWFEHQNLRDERAEAFATLLWDGVYEYTYVARATTPGVFVVPPAKAEQMYSPEVFGRSSSDRVVVE